MIAAALAAAASAGGFALSTSLQHRAAGQVADERIGGLALLLRLARQPVWGLGVAFGAVAFCLHALALSLGALALVQPIMVSGIVFAVVIRAGMERARPTTTELWAVSITAVGLTVFLIATDPTESGVAPLRGLAAAVVLTCWAICAALVLTHRRWDLEHQPFVLGVASGLMFGLSAGLVKLITYDLTDPRPTTALVAVGIAISGLTGVAINQLAYRLGPLSASMPVLNVVSVCLAVAFGGLVFGDYPALGTLAVGGQIVALLLIGIGLRLVALEPEVADDVTTRVD